MNGWEELSHTYIMKKKTVSTLFLTSVIAAAAITFNLLGKKTVDCIDISYTGYVDYNEKSDDSFIVLKKTDKYKAM